MQLLAVEKIWHERRNTRTMWTEQENQRTGRTRRRPVFFGHPGTADIFCTPRIRVQLSIDGYRYTYASVPLWVETKSDIGRQSEQQKRFQAEVEAAGHYYIIARSSDELLAWLREHGACD